MGNNPTLKISIHSSHQKPRKPKRSIFFILFSKKSLKKPPEIESQSDNPKSQMALNNRKNIDHKHDRYLEIDVPYSKENQKRLDPDVSPKFYRSSEFVRSPQMSETSK